MPSWTNKAMLAHQRQVLGASLPLVASAERRYPLELVPGASATASAAMGTGQPAPLQVSVCRPCTGGPVLVLVWRRGLIGCLWGGRPCVCASGCRGSLQCGLLPRCGRVWSRALSRLGLLPLLPGLPERAVSVSLIASHNTLIISLRLSALCFPCTGLCRPGRSAAVVLVMDAHEPVR